MPDITDDDIATAALSPQEAHDDAGGVTARSIDDLLKAADRVAGNTGVSKNHNGLRFTKLIPPGAD